MTQKKEPKLYSPQNQPLYIPNDDVDIRELFKTLWGGRLIICLIASIFAAGSICFSLLAQEWWSSNAKITEAQPQNIAAYQQQVRQFQPVFNVYQDDGTVLVSEELDMLVDPEVLFQRFINTFNSSNNKRDFLDSNQDFKELKEAIFVEGAEISEDIVRALYVEWFNRISASPVSKNDQSASYNVTFQTISKKSSFDLLNDYISVTEAKVHQDAFNNLQAMVSGKRNELIQQKIILETQAVNQLSVETERTKYAMGIARAAGVDKPIQTGNDSELFGIALGSKGLEAKVHALESVKNLSVIEPRLLQINAKLAMLNNLEIDRNVKFQTFHFLESVEQPITRDKPNRVLIVLVGTLFGCVFGILIVLVRFAFRKED